MAYSRSGELLGGDHWGSMAQEKEGRCPWRSGVRGGRGDAWPAR
jgi:hypothetical protein